MNRRGKKTEIITNSLCKTKLQQDQEKITKTNKNQFKLKQNKPKLTAKQAAKEAKKKKIFVKKRKMLT